MTLTLILLAASLALPSIASARTHPDRLLLPAEWTSTSETFATRPPAAWRADDPADSLYRAGREELNRGEYRGAARTFARIFQRYPQSVYAGDALYWQAYANYSVGALAELREAVRVLEVQRARYPKASTRGDADALAVRIRGALARLGDGASAESVAQHATADAKPCTAGRREDDDERVAAMNALLQMNPERAMPIIKTVLARRDACSASLREKAVFMVSQLRSSEKETILLDAVRNDPSLEVRKKAVFWLGQVNSDRAAELLEQLLTTSTSPQLREEAVTALMQQNSSRGHAAVRRIAEDQNAPANLREKAVFWLGQRRSAENATYLRNLFTRLGSEPATPSSESVRQKILFSLSQMRGQGNDRWLMEVASDSKHSVEMRKQAIFGAGQNGIATSELAALYGRLTERELKSQLIWVLSEQRDRDAVDRLMSIAKNDPDRELRKKAIFWLGQMKDPRVQQFLLDIING